MEIFAKMITGFQPVSILAKGSISDVRLGIECVSDSSPYVLPSYTTSIILLFIYFSLYSLLSSFIFTPHLLLPDIWAQVQMTDWAFLFCHLLRLGKYIFSELSKDISIMFGLRESSEKLHVTFTSKFLRSQFLVV